jgi:hypothetical protein
MNIELKVSLNPEGNRTLMERKEGHGWADVLKPKGMWVNNDQAQFYRVTANYIAALSQEGYRVQFQDTQLG